MWDELLEGVLSLQFRCPRSVKLYRKVIEQTDPSLDENKNKEVAMALMFNNIATAVERYANSKMVVFVSDNHDVITCETPLFNLATSKFKEKSLLVPGSRNSS